MCGIFNSLPCPRQMSVAVILAARRLRCNLFHGRFYPRFTLSNINVTPSTIYNPSYFSSSPYIGIPFRTFSWGASSHDSQLDKSGEVHLEGDGLFVGVPDHGADGDVISVMDDKFFYAPVRGLISALDGCHDVTGLPW